MLSHVSANLAACKGAAEPPCCAIMSSWTQSLAEMSKGVPREAADLKLVYVAGHKRLKGPHPLG
jgi:hypothetical protein